MDNASKNIFDIGSLYQAICDLKTTHDKLSKHKVIQRDIDRVIKKLKTALMHEIEKI